MASPEINIAMVAKQRGGNFTVHPFFCRYPAKNNRQENIIPCRFDFQVQLREVLFTCPILVVGASAAAPHSSFAAENGKSLDTFGMAVAEYHVGFSIVRTILSPVDTNNEVIDRGCR